MKALIVHPQTSYETQEVKASKLFNLLKSKEVA